MRNVAFMPQRHILKCGLRIRPHDARQPADLFALHGIALVRHRRRTLLPLTEILLRLTDFGALQVPYFGRYHVERRRDCRKCSDVIRVAVALQHLCRDWSEAQSEALADALLILRIQVREGADCARDLADAHLFCCALETADVPLSLVV